MFGGVKPRFVYLKKLKNEREKRYFGKMKHAAEDSDGFEIITILRGTVPVEW